MASHLARPAAIRQRTTAGNEQQGPWANGWDNQTTADRESFGNGVKQTVPVSTSSLWNHRNGQSDVNSQRQQMNLRGNSRIHAPPPIMIHKPLSKGHLPSSMQDLTSARSMFGTPPLSATPTPLSDGSSGGHTKAGEEGFVGTPSSVTRSFASHASWSSFSAGAFEADRVRRGGDVQNFTNATFGHSIPSYGYAIDPKPDVGNGLFHRQSSEEDEEDEEMDDTLELNEWESDGGYSQRKEKLALNLVNVREMLGEEVKKKMPPRASSSAGKSVAQILQHAYSSSETAGNTMIAQGTFTSKEIAATARQKRAHATAVAFQEYAQELENKLEAANAYQILLSERVEVLEFQRLVFGVVSAVLLPVSLLLAVSHYVDIHSLEVTPVVIGAWGLVLVVLLFSLVRLLLRVRKRMDEPVTADVRKLRAVAEKVALRHTSSSTNTEDQHNWKGADYSDSPSLATLAENDIPDSLRKRRTVSKLSV